MKKKLIKHLHSTNRKFTYQILNCPAQDALNKLKTQSESRLEKTSQILDISVFISLDLCIFIYFIIFYLILFI